MFVCAAHEQFYFKTGTITKTSIQNYTGILFADLLPNTDTGNDDGDDKCKSMGQTLTTLQRKAFLPEIQ